MNEWTLYVLVLREVSCATEPPSVCAGIVVVDVFVQFDLRLVCLVNKLECEENMYFIKFV